MLETTAIETDVPTKRDLTKIKSIGAKLAAGAAVLVGVVAVGVLAGRNGTTTETPES